MSVFREIALPVVILILHGVPVSAQERQLVSFERQSLTETYFSEGANAADINQDGSVDVIYGPFWFAGPDFKVRQEIYEPVPQKTEGYADNFFNWPFDFDGDGWKDVLVVGFPGTPAFVYQNPGSEGLDSHWPRHQVFDWVSNESPQFLDVIGDARPELLCTRDGFFGIVSVDWDKPFDAWSFHPISDQMTARRFGHGLGAGDVNGDGLTDVIHSGGWFQQPQNRAMESRWLHHPVTFSQSYGGAEMYVDDVDGDGDQDIITSHAAHDFGLAWYEQIAGGDSDEPEFRHHLIMGEHPSQNQYGVVFSELHSVALADMNGDGLKDIVTGKTYWSHHRQSPMWDAGSVVYWFERRNKKGGVEWVPHQADAKAGIGRQISIVDVNGDQLPDIVVGGMLGTTVLRQTRATVSEKEWIAAQPKPYSGPRLPSIADAKAIRGPRTAFDQSGELVGAIEAELLKREISAGTTRMQNMAGFKADRWSKDAQLWWTGARIGDQLTLQIPDCSGHVDLEIVMTTAADYGVVQLEWNQQPLGPPIDLFDRSVQTTGVLTFKDLKCKDNQNELSLKIVGANPRAKRSYMVAIDYLRIRRADGSFVEVKESRSP